MKSTIRLILFLLLSILGISFSFYAYQMVYTPNFQVDRESTVLLIKDSATFKDLQAELHDGAYVQDLVSFSFLAKIMGYNDHVKPGRYVIEKNMSNMAVIKLLRSGKQSSVRITFNNVRLMPELAEKITRNLDMSPEAFQAALIKFSMNNKYGFTKDNVMAMFIPNTYDVYFNVKPDALIARMYSEYASFWNAQRKAKAKEMGLTPIEVSVLASVTQAESIREEEEPIIAGLYLNRLRKGIALQADPTLVFAVGDFSLKRVLNEHKQIDSPYNTYKYPGLPPGPINLPEIAAIDAVLNYFHSDYYYMCAKEDFSGRHNFTNSYEEHMSNAIRYQRALTIEQKKAAQAKK